MKRVGIDFDGVIHDYRNGWKGYDVISGEPVPGIKEEIEKLINAGYEVVIITSRCLTLAGDLAVVKFLEKYNFPAQIKVTEHKLPCMAYIDDRAINYKPGMNLLETVENFVPWMMNRPIRDALE